MRYLKPSPFASFFLLVSACAPSADLVTEPDEVAATAIQTVEDSLADIGDIQSMELSEIPVARTESIPLTSADEARNAIGLWCVSVEYSARNIIDGEPLEWQDIVMVIRVTNRTGGRWQGEQISSPLVLEQYFSVEERAAILWEACLDRQLLSSATLPKMPASTSTL